MATSGVSNWNPALVDIIRKALLNATAVAEDEDVAPELYSDALASLNGLVKTIEATGAHVWTEEEAIIFLQPGIARYTIGGDTPTAHTSDADDWLELVLAQPAVQGAAAIVLQDASGVVSGMNLGVIDENGLTEWFTAASDPVGQTVALSGLLAANAPSGNFVLAYETPITRPLKIPKARTLQLNGLIETPMTPLSRQGYMDLPQKLSPGVPTQFFYSPRRSDGLFYVWPVPVLTMWAARVTWYRPLQDFLDPLNTADFPQEWVNPLIWNLAKEIAPSYGVPEPTWQRIVSMADTYALLALDYDRETEDVQFGMDYMEGR